MGRPPPPSATAAAGRHSGSGQARDTVGLRTASQQLVHARPPQVESSLEPPAVRYSSPSPCRLFHRCPLRSSQALRTGPWRPIAVQTSTYLPLQAQRIMPQSRVSSPGPEHTFECIIHSCCCPLQIKTRSANIGTAGGDHRPGPRGRQWSLRDFASTIGWLQQSGFRDEDSLLPSFASHCCLWLSTIWMSSWMPVACTALQINR